MRSKGKKHLELWNITYLGWAWVERPWSWKKTQGYLVQIQICHASSASTVPSAARCLRNQPGPITMLCRRMSVRQSETTQLEAKQRKIDKIVGPRLMTCSYTSKHWFCPPRRFEITRAKSSDGVGRTWRHLGKGQSHTTWYVVPSSKTMLFTGLQWCSIHGMNNTIYNVLYHQLLVLFEWNFLSFTIAKDNSGCVWCMIMCSMFLSNTQRGSCNNTAALQSGRPRAWKRLTIRRRQLTWNILSTMAQIRSTQQLPKLLNGGTVWYNTVS